MYISNFQKDAELKENCKEDLKWEERKSDYFSKEQMEDFIKIAKEEKKDEQTIADLEYEYAEFLL